MTDLSKSQYTIRKTGDGKSLEDTNTSKDNKNSKPNKGSGNDIGDILGGIADIIGSGADLTDAINNAANGADPTANNNNNYPPNPNTNKTTDSQINPLWVGLGVGTVVLLIVGLLIYTNGNNKPKASS